MNSAHGQYVVMRKDRGGWIGQGQKLLHRFGAGCLSRPAFHDKGGVKEETRRP
jgi:hypothetical protein